VKVGRWLWIYDFSDGGRVRWTDAFNNETGQGTWKIVADHMVFKWSSQTIERWNFPLRPANQKGHCRLEGEGDFGLNAVKI
jgi:hypothetical protein